MCDYYCIPIFIISYIQIIDGSSVVMIVVYDFKYHNNYINGTLLQFSKKGKLEHIRLDNQSYNLSKHSK